MQTAVVLLGALAVATPTVAWGAGDDGAPAVELPPAQLPAPPPQHMAPPEAPRQKGRWYGWELMLSDTLFLLVVADQGHETGLGSHGVPLGLAGMAAVTPALHFIHGNPRRAGISMLIRGGAAALVALARDTLDDDTSSPAPSCGDHCAEIDIDAGDVMLAGLAAIAAGGAITYAVTEYFRFSRVPVAAPARPRATITPTAALHRGGGGLALVGSF